MLKKIIIFFFIVIIIFLSYLLIKYNKFLNDKQPLLNIDDFFKFEDDGTIVYNGILYSEITYTNISTRPVNGKVKNRTFKTILFSKTIYDSVPYIVTPVISSEFDLIDDMKTCSDTIEKFYVDDTYAYYFSCIKSDKVFLKFHDGTIIPVKEALNKNIVTIDTLKEKGLNFSKEPIKNVINKISYNELMKSINNKESFILLIYRDDCGHCKLYEPKFNKILFMNDLTAKSINTKSLFKREQEVFFDEFNIEGTPTTVFIENGKEKDTDTRIVGNQSEEIIINSLKERGYLMK